MNKKLYDDRGVTVTSSSNDDVLILTIDRKENVFNPELVLLLNKALDIIDKQDHPKSLIVTGGEGSKFFSNGLDLKFMSTHDGEDITKWIESIWRLLGRILILDMRVVAAINGHAFGAGLFLALCCDYRVMRTKRGYLNWPELNLGMPLAYGFAEISKVKVFNKKTLRDGVFTARRYSSNEALSCELIDYECPIEDLLEKATEFAKAGLPDNLNLQFFNPDSLRQMKIEIYTDAYNALTFGKVNSVPSQPHSRL